MTAGFAAKSLEPPTASELLPSVPGVDIWFAAILEDFATAVDQRGAFEKLSWRDARRVAGTIAADITGDGHPRERLALHARSTSNCADLDDAAAVCRALAIAAELSALRPYGIRWS